MTARFSTLLHGRTRLAKRTRDEAVTTSRALEQVTARRRRAFAAMFLAHMDRLREQVDARFAAFVAAGNEDAALGRVDFAAAHGPLAEDLAEILAAAYLAAGDKAQELSTLAKVRKQPEIDVGFRISPHREDDVLRIAQERTAKLVTAVTPDQRAALRRAIRAAIERGDNPRQVTSSITPIVGNLDRSVKAAEALRERLTNKGQLSRAKIDERVARYSARLLRQRGEMIARTEMLWANNEAQLDFWRRSADAGLFNRQTAERVWVVTDDDRLCEQCAPMDGVTVGFDADFVSTELGLPGQELRPRPQPETTEHPPLHPMCRCTTSLRIP